MYWAYLFHFTLTFIHSFLLVLGQDLKAFDDTILFKIDWPGKAGTDLLESEVNKEPYTITTADNEQYQCFIPEVVDQTVVQEEPYTGPNPIEFLYLLFNQNTCSYRLDPYWTYELCHGRYVQQYHEERDGKKVKIQTYELGKFDSTQINKLSAQYNEYAKNPNRKSEIPVKKIDGINMPYVEMEMTDGTVCDLNNKPRSIKVLYVCFQHGKQDIYSIKETATCEYETVVLTPYLCGHPDYKPQDTEENKINCRSVDNAPKKPVSMLKMELESWKSRFQQVMDEKPQKVYAIFHVARDGQDGQTQIRVEIHPADASGKHYNLDDSLNPLTDRANDLIKSSSAENFLSGNNCLIGGNGWWKYEFCYGVSVTQYHIEIGGPKTSVSLGVFDVLEHMNWIKANPHKKPKPIGLRKQVSHFYNHGTICDKTGKPRQTEVKLKCVSNVAGSPSSVSLYLLEPKVCEYILGVESPFICNFLEHADDTYGLISNKVFLNGDELKTNIHIEDEDERIANEDE